MDPSSRAGRRGNQESPVDWSFVDGAVWGWKLSEDADGAAGPRGVCNRSLRALPSPRRRSDEERGQPKKRDRTETQIHNSLL